jgi:hypothetical protein
VVIVEGEQEAANARWVRRGQREARATAPARLFDAELDSIIAPTGEVEQLINK